MRIQTGRVTKSEVKRNKDGLSDVLMLQVEMTDPDDIQSVELFTQAGDNYNPPIDTIVTVVEAGNAWKIALGCDDGITPGGDYGEREIYSSLSGTKKARIILKKTGEIEIKNDLGYIKIGVTGTVDINGNLTVDP